MAMTWRQFSGYLRQARRRRAQRRLDRISDLRVAMSTKGGDDLVAALTRAARG